jgi:hypothetical protein
MWETPVTAGRLCPQELPSPKSRQEANPKTSPNGFRIFIIVLFVLGIRPRVHLLSAVRECSAPVSRWRATRQTLV